MGLFGTPGAAGQGAAPPWLHNAGFVWLPFIAASALAAWFGMDDLAEARAGFAEQAVIFTRKHNWLMCWLYGGSFGSFIGFSAGLPMLMLSQFGASPLLQLAWLGPLIGALGRPLGGWLADRWGGARVSFWSFAGLALFLSALGIYGVLAYDVSQRTREIGIRSAIGASREQVLGLVLKQGLLKSSLGVVIGLIGAFLLSRFMTSLLFDVKPTDPVVYLVVSLVLIAVALLASYLPARRAARIDALVALRDE